MNSGSKIEGITQHGKTFVAFLDIMGFKEMVKNTNDDGLIQRFNNLTTIVAKHLNKESHFDNNTNEFIYTVSKYQNINTLIVSDSILLWTTYEDLYAYPLLLIKAVNEIIFYALADDLPIRGAIVYDELTSFNRREQTAGINMEASIIGNGLVKAYELADAQDWVGCYIDDSAIYHIDKLIKDDEDYLKEIGLIKPNDYSLLIEKSFGVQYSIPFKSGRKEGYAVKWCEVNDTFINNPEKIIPAFEWNKKYRGQSSVKIKIDNTIEYLKFMKNR